MVFCISATEVLGYKH